MKKLSSLLMATAAGFAAWPTSTSYACSATLCQSPIVFPVSGTMPANMQRLRFLPGYPMSEDGGAPAPRLYRLEGNTKVSVPFESERISDSSSWIEPSEAQAVGTMLALEFERAPGCTPPSAMYTVTEAKPLPTALGTLTSSAARKTIRVASGASCSEEVDAAYVDFEVQLAAEAQPYASLFVYQTYLDGERYSRFASSTATGEGLPHGEDRVFTRCGNDPNARWRNETSEGTHRVRFEGTLPDGTKLSTPEVSFELRCGNAPIDAGIQHDAGARPDSGVLKGGVDSGLQPTRESSEDDGCSLASTRSGFSGLVVVLALLLRRRQRRGSLHAAVRPSGLRRPQDEIAEVRAVGRTASAHAATSLAAVCLRRF